MGALRGAWRKQLKIYVNGRFRAHKITGVQRVAQEIISRLAQDIDVCEPRRKLRGWQGHLWEQTILPTQCRSGILWSPCASGPLLMPRQIVTFHDLFPIDSPHWYSKTYAVWYRTAMRRLAHTATHLIAVSQFTKERICSALQIDESKITVIPNGVDGRFFQVNAEWVKSAQHLLKLPSENYFLCVGSLEPRKNLPRLFSAWQSALSYIPEDHWLIVTGKGDNKVFMDIGKG